MKFNAIICEFNPFTKGHEYIIKEIKKLSDNPLLCIMSGNFVQRGEPAILDKFTRASHAIMAGADIVIELPTIYSLSSAPDFAFGAVKTLNAIGNIENLYFGSESGNLEKLIVEAEKDFASVEIHKKLQNGESFASATATTSEILRYPNNILAVEYLRALKKTSSQIVPITIQRTANYNSTNICSMPSATSLRKLITDGCYSDFCKNAPPYSVCNNTEYEFSSQIENLIDFKIKSITPEEFSNINGVSEGIEFRIADSIFKTGNIEKRIEKINTKRYPETKIKRILCNALLGITKEVVNNAKNLESEYIKILAINKNKTDLLSCLPNEIIVTGKKDLTKLNNNALSVIDFDIKASKVYSCIKCTYHPSSDFTIGFKKI